VGSGIVVMDRDGRVVQCNPYMERFLGVVGPRCSGAPTRGVFPDLGADSFEQALGRVLAGGVVLSPDMPVNRSSSGNSVWAIATLAPYRNSDGRVIGAIAVVSDISSRKERRRPCIPAKNNCGRRRSWMRWGAWQAALLTT